MQYFVSVVWNLELIVYDSVFGARWVCQSCRAWSPARENFPPLVIIMYFYTICIISYKYGCIWLITLWPAISGSGTPLPDKRTIGGYCQMYLLSSAQSQPSKLTPTLSWQYFEFLKQECWHAWVYRLPISRISYNKASNAAALAGGKQS